ncbi:SDR family NAD(P)-dependent oxidoreductase [Dyadobacter sediminis]|uniref:SDR family NAD(P)-dependent oxidoreductase n=1 Tax=Dyadobacter sediminis TaxID=1493691 RepID=A0A5R9KBD3_9BACT|nr:SDR family NAD(P)-dependent oxidoreductase [Dyadobacter sediminis]TLU92116.1 SDR family NAD(P)-dependent oxidoreductase [Dyadobacter sediminis]GGB97294.1 short-chain dehydrogenase [Dyadobacter sediminis]
MEVQSKVALVTGANQGVGFQIAKALADQGYTVYAGSRNLQNGITAVGKIGGKARAIQIDVTDKNSVEKAVSTVQQEFGRLDLLVNNAAISHAGAPGRTLEEIMAANRPSISSVDEMRTVWETNVFGVVVVTQAFLPLLRKATAPRIVNVSSGLASLTLARDPQNPYAPHYELIYGASKTAMNAVTVAFANELEKSGIKVSAVSPGFTATALNNFQGTDSVEVGSQEPVRVALEEDGPTALFTGPNQEVYPW